MMLTFCVCGFTGELAQNKGAMARGRSGRDICRFYHFLRCFTSVANPSGKEVSHQPVVTAT